MAPFDSRMLALDGSMRRELSSLIVMFKRMVVVDVRLSGDPSGI